MMRRHRGNLGESAVLNAFVKRGFDVLVPFGDGQPFDLVVHLEDDRFLRVQCKTGWSGRGTVLFNSLSTDHGNGPRSYRGLADVFGVHYPSRDVVYLVPVALLTGSEGRLRLEPPRNNQRRRIRFAVDYEIDPWSRAALLEVLAGTRSTSPSLDEQPVSLAPAVVSR
jgi:hypothetical protein